MSFSVPDSSPPSTPGRTDDEWTSTLSTTPAGPPPSSYKSSQLRPRSNLRFSQSIDSQSGGNFDGSESLFSSLSSSNLPPLPSHAPSFCSSFGAPPGSGLANGGKFTFGARANSRNRMTEKDNDLEEEVDGEEDDEEFEDEEEEGEDEEYEESEEESEEEAEEDEDDDEVEEEEDDGDVEDNESDEMDAEPTSSRFSLSDLRSSTTGPRSSIPTKKKLIYSNPDNAKRAKLDEKWATSSPSQPKITVGPRKKPSQMPSLVRNLVSSSSLAKVDEPGDLIIQTEDYIASLVHRVESGELGEDERSEILSETSRNLVETWTAIANDIRRRSGRSRPDTAFGPGEKATGVEKAAYICSLLLSLFHPPAKGQENIRDQEFRGTRQSLVLARPQANATVPIPKVLLDWLNENHLATDTEVEALRATSPNPTAAADFWDIIQAGVMRGRFRDMAELLRSADFNYARSALQDGLTQPGYRGVELQNIQKVVNRLVQLLESSPAAQNDDWNMTGFDWAAYRKRVNSALLELQEFAEGQDSLPRQSFETGTQLQAPNFGLPQRSNAGQGFFTQSLRRAESRIPWSIYESIKGIYGILLGDASAVIAVSEDWVEATVGLTVWWNGDEEEAGRSVNGLGGSKSQSILRTEDANPYLRRLEYSFATVTDESAKGKRFQPNSLDSQEVALASVFEGNVDGVVRLLQTWSLCIAVAVVEVASIGGWLQTGAGNASMPGFLSENDLMVLSYGQDGPSIDKIQKDEILTNYAEGLAAREKIRYQDETHAGWEIALAVLRRVRNPEIKQKKVPEFLEGVSLDTFEEVNNSVITLTEFGFESEGRKLSEKHGDRVLNSTGDCDYGLAMICFARARARRKVKDVANMLIAHSLAQSRAYPPEEKLSGQLRSLIRDPKKTLSSVAETDSEAARILQFYASGYATLRRYYEIRDGTATEKDGRPLKLKPLARKLAAADALVAVIRSSADCIYGGLYDNERDSAVLVDALLALLGEALVFVDGSSLLPLSHQATILAAIEDLETVTPRVFAACAEFLDKTLTEYRNEKQPSKRPTPTQPPSFPSLKRNASSTLTTSTASSFSFIGSEVLPAVADTDIGTTTVSRGWDWRDALATAPDDKEASDIAREMLRVLRLKLARGMALR